MIHDGHAHADERDHQGDEDYHRLAPRAQHEHTGDERENDMEGGQVGVINGEDSLTLMLSMRTTAEAALTAACTQSRLASAIQNAPKMVNVA